MIGPILASERPPPATSPPRTAAARRTGTAARRPRCRGPRPPVLTEPGTSPRDGVGEHRDAQRDHGATSPRPTPPSPTAPPARQARSPAPARPTTPPRSRPGRRDAGNGTASQVVHHLRDGVGHVEHVADNPQSALNHRPAPADGGLGERVEAAGRGDLLGEAPPDQKRRREQRGSRQQHQPGRVQRAAADGVGQHDREQREWSADRADGEPPDQRRRKRPQRIRPSRRRSQCCRSRMNRRRSWIRHRPRRRRCRR